MRARDRPRSRKAPALLDSEHRELLVRTRDLIERTRREIAELREEIHAAQETIELSSKLLLRSGSRKAGKSALIGTEEGLG